MNFAGRDGGRFSICALMFPVFKKFYKINFVVGVCVLISYFLWEGVFVVSLLVISVLCVGVLLVIG